MQVIFVPVPVIYVGSGLSLCFGAVHSIIGDNILIVFSRMRKFKMYWGTLRKILKVLFQPRVWVSQLPLTSYSIL